MSIPPFKEAEMLGDGRGHLTLQKLSAYPRPNVATKTPCHPKDHNPLFIGDPSKKSKERKDQKILEHSRGAVEDFFSAFFFWKSWVFKKLCGIDKTPTWKICEKIQLERYQLDGRNPKPTTWDVNKKTCKLRDRRPINWLAGVLNHRQKFL